MRSSSLLGLPLELRHEILAFVVPTERAPPQDASNPEGRAGWKGYDRNQVVYESREPNRWELIPTLLVNWQLYEETLHIMRKLLSGKHSYKMDVIVVNEKQLWPTWLSVQESTSRIENLHVTFRLSPAKRQETKDHFHYGSPSFPGVNCNPGLMNWCFWQLLDDFLRFGPPGTRKKGISDRGDAGIHSLVIIKTLELDVSTTYAWMSPYGPQIYDDSEDLHVPILPDDDTICNVINPNYLLRFVNDEIDTLLRMPGDAAQYGRYLYERIGKICLTLDGKLVEEINLAERLETLRFDDSFRRLDGMDLSRAQRQLIFDRWKLRARTLREELGFSGDSHFSCPPKNSDKADGGLSANSKDSALSFDGPWLFNPLSPLRHLLLVRRGRK